MSGTVQDYGFVLHGWRPGAAATDWKPITHLGLDYILFRATVGDVTAECRVDPCPVPATAPYAAMVRRDMDLELAKAARGIPPAETTRD